jgi:ABC-type glycerol-3-phosphate transport system substrate-binding protein
VTRTTRSASAIAAERLPVAAAALFIALGVILGGCASDDGGDVELVFAAGNDPSGATEALVAEYNAAHPGVTVLFQPMPANTDTQHDAYVTYLSARESNIDLYSLDVIWTAEFAKAGWITELPEGFLDESEFLEGPLGSVTYQGTLRAVPWFTDAGVLYYRSDLLEEAGLPVPETWDEFLHACETVAAPRDMDGFVWQGARYEGLVCDFLEFLWGMGGSLDLQALVSDPSGAGDRIAATLTMMRALSPRDTRSSCETGRTPGAWPRARSRRSRAPWAWRPSRTRPGRRRIRLSVGGTSPCLRIPSTRTRRSIS